MNNVFKKSATCLVGGAIAATPFSNLRPDCSPLCQLDLYVEQDHTHQDPEPTEQVREMQVAVVSSSASGTTRLGAYIYANGEQVSPEVFNTTSWVRSPSRS